MNSNRERETSLSERTLSGLGWSYLSTFIKALLSLLVLVILARLLTPVDFGLLAIAWIFILTGSEVWTVRRRAGNRSTRRVDRPPHSSRFHPLNGGRHRHYGNHLVARPASR